MATTRVNALSPVLFIPHGAGPLPLLGDKGHQEVIEFLREITPRLGKPSAILVISAHWEADKATITSSKKPPLFYDYSGFPEQAYAIEYPVPGSPALAEKILGLLQQHGIDAALDDQRGFDHGVFVPLKIMFPNADIPCVQLSLLRHLDPSAHIKIGQALAELRKDKVLIMGSGFSFHNMEAFFSANRNLPDSKNEAFQDWLIDACTNKVMTDEVRQAQLIDWANAPFASYCHPREEHLLPLHVCAGFANTAAAEVVFNGNVAGKKACAFLW